MVSKRAAEVVVVAGREVTISNPQKVLFPKPKHTKLDLVRYYITVAEGALRGAGGRPNMLVRYPDGIEGEHFYQKRAPRARPGWIEVAELRFSSGRRAQEVVPRDAAALAWLANLACLELHPHAVRADDLDHPDELRVDLDPVWITHEHVRPATRPAQRSFSDRNVVSDKVQLGMLRLWKQYLLRVRDRDLTPGNDDDLSCALADHL